MQWLSVSEVSKIEGVTERTIRTRIKNNKYEYRYVHGKGGNKGQVFQIALESLPQEAQDRYNNKETEQKPILQYTSKQREEADRKAQIVVDYQRSNLSINEFIDNYNANHLHERKLTKSQLYKWQSKFKASGDVADLIDTRGANRKGISSIPQEAWDYFYSIYMTQQRRTVRLCYTLTQEAFPYLNLPSEKTFARKVKKIPEYAILYYRHGKTAFNDNSPCMTRDYTDIDSNDVWYSDHHRADVFVRDKHGNVFRPWITMWSDARSRKIMSYRVRKESPNTDIVKDTLREAIQSFGIPKEVYVDNGKDYRAKDGLNKDYPLSLVNRLGINTIYATAYHGQAKNIERFFRTLEEQFGKLFPTYSGSDAKEKPESLKDVPLEDYPLLEEYIEALGGYLDRYHNAAHRGDGMSNKSPNQVYYENLKVKKVIRDKEALRLLCGRVDTRKVSKNGIHIFDNEYWHDELVAHFKEEVTIIYDPSNIEELNIFDTQGKAICVATPKIKTPFRTTSSEDFRQAKRKQANAKKVIKEHEPAREMHPWQIIAQNQAIEKSYEEQATTSNVDVLTPQTNENIEILNASKKTSSRKKPEEDVALSLYNYYTTMKAQSN